MIAINDEMAGLMREHEAIRAQMKVLIASLNSLAAQSNLGTAQPAQVKDHIWQYRQKLWDFQETIRRHIELDERLFKAILVSPLIEEVIKEHQDIQKKVNDAVSLASNAVENELSREEMNQSALTIREIIDRICTAIELHTAKEDRLLRLI